MKLAKFKRLGERSWETVCDDDFEQIADYVRISEYVDVEFPPLKEEAVIDRQLEALDRAEAALRTKFQSALNDIEQQRADLRAITCPIAGAVATVEQVSMKRKRRLVGESSEHDQAQVLDRLARR